MLKLDGVQVEIKGFVILRGVTLEIPEGGVIGLVGGVIGVVRRRSTKGSRMGV